MARKRPSRPPNRIDPNEVKTRDHLLVALITGATKAGVQKDRRKEANRTACRRQHDDEG